MKKIFLLIACVVLALNTYASHFSGGEIRYEFNGTNYDVYLYVYKTCEKSSASLPNAASINLKSVSQSVNNTIGLNFQGFDTVNVSCPTSASICLNPNGTIPGYIKASFKGTVTLPSTASDWVLSYTNSARIGGIANLTSSSSVMYLYTNIDNSTAINSNPLMASSPSYFMKVNTNTVIPLQSIDPEGDVLQYDLVAPKTAAGANATYTTGYSATAPLGSTGTATINSTNNTLTLNAPNQGLYALCLRVREYRNSVLVGEYIREFTVAVLSGTGAGVTIPKPTSTTNFTYFTCPGQTTNSIVLNFLDPTTTDSVYLDVTTPSLSGWTFNTSVANGIPSASATITWTTPTTLNPATLPHFFIKVRARDNACPARAISDYAVVVRTRQCNVDSVWPGDANGDFTVNIYDPLAIAIAAGQTGPTRPGANTTWTAQACNNWTNSFATNNTNMKHADCNGDGTVNNSDLAAVTANYSLFHNKGANKTTGSNDLYLDMTNVHMAPGATVSIPIKLGSSTQTISDVYGIATRIQIDGLSLNTAPTISNTNSWLDNSGSAINFSHPISNTVVDWALGRTNQMDVSGQGEIGSLNFTIPTNATMGTNYTISFMNTVIINKDGMERYDVNAVDETGILLHPQSIAGQIGEGFESVSIVPNPSSNTAILNIDLDKDALVSVSVSDITGKIVWSTSDNYNKGKQQIQLPSSKIPNGIYMVRLSTNVGSRSFIKWVKK